MFRKNAKKPIKGVTRRGRYYELAIVDARVKNCRGFVLEFDDAKETIISLQFCFTLQLKTESFAVNLTKPSGEVHLEELRGAAVTSALAEESGALHLKFDNGAAIDVPPSVYEPWECRNNKNLYVVSVAGGGLAIWEER